MEKINSILSPLSNVNESTKPAQKTANADFESFLKKEIEELNESQLKADDASAKVATGELKDLHQAALAINEAEKRLSFMLEVRNKAINAYKEISRTQL